MRTSQHVRKIVAIILCATVFVCGISTVFSFGETEKGVAQAEVFLRDQAVYTLKNANSGLYMDVNGAGVGNNYNLIQWSETNERNQMFVLRKLNEDQQLYDDWMICPFHVPNLAVAVDVSGGSSATGAQLITYEKTANANQLYRIVPHDDVSGAYEILTGASGYSKAIGVDGIMGGENCTQQGHSSQTAWYIEKVWYETRVSDGCAVGGALAPAEHPIFGTPTLYATSTIDKQVVSREHPVYDTEYTTIRDYNIVYWKYSIPVNAVLQRVNLASQTLAPGEAANTVTYTSSMSQSFTFAQSITTARTESNTAGIEAGASFEALKVGLSSSSTVSNTITNQMSYTQTYDTSTSVGIIFNYTNNTSNIVECHLDFRGNLYLIVAQVYKVNYTVSQTSEGSLGWWTRYTYTPFLQTCEEEIFNWQVDANSIQLDLYPYQNTANGYVYIGNKYSGILYI